MDSRAPIRPVAFAEGLAAFRVVADAEGMAQALWSLGDRSTIEYQAAAISCLGLAAGTTDPEVARADFILALRAAGVMVRER